MWLDNQFYINLEPDFYCMRHTYFLLIIFSFFVLKAPAQTGLNTQNFDKYQGYFTYYHDSEKDKIYLEVKDLEKEFLYVYSLSSGIGSNDIGLDRGQLGNEQVVFFKKTGNKKNAFSGNGGFNGKDAGRRKITIYQRAMIILS